MADYFTHFSCTLPLDDESQMQKALALYEVSAAKIEHEESAAIGFSLQALPEPSPHLWIWSKDHGDTDHVTAFVSTLGPALELGGLWGFEWAHTCSKPLAEAFGGGAATIDLATGEIVDTISTNQWLTRMIEDHLKAEV